MPAAALLLVLSLVLAAPGAAQAHGEHSVRATLGPGGCPGAERPVSRVIAGAFPGDLQGSYVMVPFEVPAGTTAVRVRYCYDQPERRLLPMAAHTVDLGLWEARPAGGDWGPAQFRGWGGSSHPEVIVSEQGYTSEAFYRERPTANQPGRTTRGFRPGDIPAGEWAVELGVAGVAGRELGDADGRVAWRVEIELSADPSFDDEPYVIAPYDPAPARSGPGWYAGDLHVHAEHSALKDATMTEAFGYAFRPAAQGGAGLDFLTLSDYVTDTAWAEIGRHQGAHPGRLIARSSEVITYRGHINNHASERYVDHRTGPVYERRADGTLERRRGARPASEVFADIRAAGGVTQINHPTIFPSAVPTFDLFCRGCSWSYPRSETDYAQVDAIEVATGPASVPREPDLVPNPFSALALVFYEDALSTGARIAAVGSSDSHNAGRANNPLTQSPIGQATTVVYADELSEAGLRRGIRARHTYVKLFGSAGPDLRLEARVPGTDGPPAIMGDVVRSDAAQFTARVLGADPALAFQLVVVKDGLPILVVPVLSRDFTLPFPSLGAGRYRLQLQRLTAIEGVTSPIWLDRSAGPEPPRADPPPEVVRASLPDRRLRVRRGRATVRCAARGYAVRTCRIELRARARGRRPRVIGRGSAALRDGAARVRVRLTPAGRRLVARRSRGRRAGAAVTVRALAIGPRGALEPVRRRARLRAAR